jgi:hypothetical protein
MDRGIPDDRAALVASALALAGFLGRLLTGVLLDRFPGLDPFPRPAN